MSFIITFSTNVKSVRQLVQQSKRWTGRFDDLDLELYDDSYSSSSIEGIICKNNPYAL
jgi:hypothetical protein